MATYNLEENPNLFIAPKLYNDKFLYRLFLLDEEETETLVHIIDLRSDKLMIYGTQIQDSVLDRLHQSLVLKQVMGSLRVNCNGACYFVVTGKGRCAPVHNVIFDWAPFGVTVPNSINDALRKKLEQKEKEIEELKRQLCAGNSELQQPASATHNKEVLDIGPELQKLLSELQSTKTELLESSTRVVREFEDQMKESLAQHGELQKVKDELCGVNSELNSTKTRLEFSNRRVKELEGQLSELQCSRTMLEASVKMLQEIKDCVFIWNRKDLRRGEELRKLCDCVGRVEPEVKFTRRKVEEMLNQLGRVCHYQCRVMSGNSLLVPEEGRGCGSELTKSVAIEEEVHGI